MAGKDKGGGRKGGDGDAALWDHVAKTVRPLSGRRRAAPPELPPVKNPAAPSRRPSPPPVSAPSAELRGVPPGIDRRTEEKFQRGEMKIAARLDLHGMTQDDACDALRDFIPRAWGSGKRCVLIITGKGKGVLKTRVPQWLGAPDLAGMVLRTAPAKPQHGGDGALYVLLRRRR